MLRNVSYTILIRGLRPSWRRNRMSCRNNCCGQNERLVFELSPASEVCDHLGDATWCPVVIVVVDKTSYLSLDFLQLGDTFTCWWVPYRRSFCLFDLILYVPSTIFQLYRDEFSWVGPVLSWNKCVLLKDHNAVTPVRLIQEKCTLGSVSRALFRLFAWPLRLRLKKPRVCNALAAVASTDYLWVHAGLG